MRMQNWQMQDTVEATEKKRGTAGVSALLGLVVGLGLTPSVWGTTYTVSTINVPFAGATDTQANGINDRGQIVGSYEGNYSGLRGTYGFLDSGGTFSTIAAPVSSFAPPHPPIASTTVASGINDHGQIVGFYIDPGTLNAYGFLDSGGTFSSIASGIDDSLATGINNSGQIVGWHDTAGLLPDHGFLINGGIIGGTISPIDFPGATSTQVSGINDSGQIVGNYLDASLSSHAFLDSRGTFSTINFPGATNTQVSGINDSGQIVGNYLDASHHSHVFLDSGGTFSTINVPFAGVTGINDHGQIVGFYSGGGFLATPVPEPASGVLLSLVLIMTHLGSRAIRKRRRGRTHVLAGL